MLQALLSIVELASSIASMAATATKPPAGLTDKHRWMTVTVFNQTQFEIVWMGNAHFSSGRFWTAPTNIGPFKSVAFSVCNSDGTVLTGCTGGAAYKIQLSDGSSVPFAVGFANPQSGSMKASVVLSGNPEDAYNAADDKSMAISTSPIQGTDTKGNAVNLSFMMAASPGQEMSITITQVEQPVTRS